ncbi:PspC domain-containing protein [Mangrovimonas aestuarii]|uniref:PspC domain-containing protein n=1 Tax=Mangrovimonas aestuarii TaxID=3018443 RepID=UPI0023796F69|nr:PspC domain-containing protein [Mangrovimonas aestuarii]
MNKTVNINLAGIFFHIDEDAYLKLQRYLEAIKRSFTDSQGQSEIISDIEARIAELFTERMKHDKQVISTKEVDEVIAIMGQPEDYLVDDEIFEDEPRTSSRPTKKLFRDTDNSYIGGVSSGLGHYLGIDAIWVRLLWILLTLGSGGTFILIYILFWILVPEAVTTADKLTMRGEPVNISNIEKKIKDGFDSVSETVKSVDYDKYGQKIKTGSKSFFDTVGDIFMSLLKVFAKVVGLFLILIGAGALLALLISFITVGVAGMSHLPGFHFVEAANAANVPIWLISMLVFFTIGIPFFFILYLGLKILINNLKSIGNIAKFTLLGLWLVSIIGLFIIGVKQFNEHAFDASVNKTEILPVHTGDTLRLQMKGNPNYSKSIYRGHDNYKVVFNESDEKLIYTSDVRLIVRSTKDSVASLLIEKSAEGNSYQSARERAQNIDYTFDLDLPFTSNTKTLHLNSYVTVPFKDKFRDQKVDIILYLPEGTILFADENTYSFHRNSSHYNDILENGMEEHYLLIKDDNVKCLDCINTEFDVNINIKKKENGSGIKINDNGIEIQSEEGNLTIDENGIKGESDNVKVNIDEDGIDISSEKDE